jgi:predicted dehydrogenase
MSKLRVGVVGVGHIGTNHARLYAELPQGQFSAILETDTTKAEQLASDYGVSAATSLEDFAERVDAASIATRRAVISTSRASCWNAASIC